MYIVFLCSYLSVVILNETLTFHTLSLTPPLSMYDRTYDSTGNNQVVKVLPKRLETEDKKREVCFLGILEPLGNLSLGVNKNYF